MPPEAEIDWVTDPALHEILADLKTYEPIFHRREKGTSRADFQRMTASDFRCQKLADDLYLLTYNLTQNRTRQTRRSTIWRSTSQGWQIVFHQGTILQPERSFPSRTRNATLPIPIRNERAFYGCLIAGLRSLKFRAIHSSQLSQFAFSATLAESRMTES